ncbi:hypothetical protein QBC43DRAFT_270885 [Cladorrhinum sp. PSN259]|nr:hypothetical protein QBC43DRAFT_270885 [Cladorrhinum sp. PSN259]
MQNTLLSVILATAATGLLAEAARPCANPRTGANFQYLLGNVRYDGPDPSVNGGLSTIAVSLQSPTHTTLYNCVAMWPEAWAGWYNNGSSPVWADCAFTGAGSGQDEIVSFAVDWRKQRIYLAHIFACSDKPGSEGLAAGTNTLNLNCTTATDGSNHCIPRDTKDGSPAFSPIITTLAQAPLNATLRCEAPKPYQSWKLQDWVRYVELHPGASPGGGKPDSQSGPSFKLVSIPGGNSMNCTTSEPWKQTNGTSVGKCQSANPGIPAASFSFDSDLDILSISQHSKCTDSLRNDLAGVFYMQDSCQRGVNGDRFQIACTSGPVWIGMETF